MINTLSKAKYNAAYLEKEAVREENAKMRKEVLELKESLDRSVASNKIEVCVYVYIFLLL